MKRIISVAFVFLTIFSSFTMFAYANEEYPIKRENLRIRDPFVLVYEDKYYMYGTCLSNGEGYGCCVSENLENWSYPVQVFSPDSNFDGYLDYWAPECHYYNGNFYLFATYKSEKSQKRGVGIFKSASPLGPFTEISNGHITPKDIDCIDGTLYVDESGQPWMVYVNEWTSQPDENGEMAAAMLSKDLTEFISEPINLFRSNKHIWTKGNVTDGCFMYRTTEGKLIMLWSNFARSGGYAVGMAVSDNGKVNGNWIHNPDAFYKETRNNLEGGHPMLFETIEGQLTMAIHSPNTGKNGIFETAQFIPVEDIGDTIIFKDDISGKFKSFMFEIYYKIVSFFFCDFLIERYDDEHPAE